MIFNMKQTILPIFHHTDQTATLKECGVNYCLAECEIRPVKFYQIVAISPYFQDGKEYCSIHANGTEYICTWTIDKVEEKINE